MNNNNSSNHSLGVSGNHELTLAERDYECDLQGVVNNSVYMNYLEHARHEFLKSRGVDFAEVTASGIHLVVVKAELEYRASLTSGDNFSVRTRVEQEGRLKFVFLQEILRTLDQALMLKARITTTALNERGRPFYPEKLVKKFI
jgi:acyl-CoA thioester hydrolase